MSNNSDTYPFTTFNFRVEITFNDKNVCHAAFSECDGLEMTMTPKTLREGGNNTQQFHLSGPVSYSTLTLKRGMTEDFDLWNWFNYINQNTTGRRYRSDGHVLINAADGKTASVNFKLKNCLPIKMRAPSLNAKDGNIAIEEMQIAYETLTIEQEKPKKSESRQNTKS